MFLMSHFTLIPLDNYNNKKSANSFELADFLCVHMPWESSSVKFGSNFSKGYFYNYFSFVANRVFGSIFSIFILLQHFLPHFKAVWFK